MRNLTKVLVVVFVAGQGLTSCSKPETIAEEEELYEIVATEGDNGHEDDRGNN